MLSEAKSKDEFRRIQVMYLRVKFGMSAVEVAAATNYSVSHVTQIQCRYFRRGLQALKPEKKGGRYRCRVSLEEERAFIERHRREAEAGGILTVGELRQAFEEELGVSLSSSAFYALLVRHNWRKVAPRKKHPQQDAEAMEAFKKTLVKRLR